MYISLVLLSQNRTQTKISGDPELIPMHALRPHYQAHAKKCRFFTLLGRSDCHNNNQEISEKTQNAANSITPRENKNNTEKKIIQNNYNMRNQMENYLH